MAAALAAAGAVAGCAAGDTSPVVSGDAVADSALADARPTDLGLDAGAGAEGLSDAAGGADDGAPAADGAVEPLPATAFEPGVNAVGQHHPEAFAPLGGGDVLTIELGAQGLWMVVTAFRTRGIFTPPLTVEAWLEVGGAMQAELGLAGQVLAAGGDGYEYYYDLFLVLESAAPGGGGAQDATLRLRVRDTLGQERDRTLAVVLQPAPGAP